MLPFGMQSVNDDNRSPEPTDDPQKGQPSAIRRYQPKYWLITIKLLLPVLILGYLVRHMSVSHPESMRELWYRPKSIPGLFLATAVILFAVLTSFVRWYVLVAALKLPFPIKSALRLGFVGYFMNFVSAGGVGGDVFKAALMVREIKSRRSAALATIFLDRFMGLYALALLACIVTLGVGTNSSGELGQFVRLLPLITALLTLGGFAVLIALGSDNWLSRIIRRFPWASSIIHDLLVTAHAYRSKKFACLIALCLSVLVHFFSATGHYVLALSLLAPPGPTYPEHLVMTPLANAAAVLPLTPGGLGTYEMALTYLFDHYPANGTGTGRGFSVALGYRLQTLMIAGIGLICSIVSRRRIPS